MPLECLDLLEIYSAMFDNKPPGINEMLIERHQMIMSKLLLWPEFDYGVSSEKASEFLNLNQVAELLGQSYYQVRSMVLSDELLSTRTRGDSGHYLILPETVRDYVERTNRLDSNHV